MTQIHVEPKLPMLDAGVVLAMIYRDLLGLCAAAPAMAQLMANDTQGCCDSESVVQEPEGQHQS